ncbi:hypothetical protein Ahy_B06g082314 [Arachis hypogaea]|uniref:Uncharacterized protein n=1 Tax=Arachis hypogaea TaxID=3818 RepID=A0A444YN87_ARAHY|nr:hypothetical protein Ahy_B06g082314 [Arachis hypogaea]
MHVPNQDQEVFVSSPAIVAADTDDDNPAVLVMGRKLFHSPTPTCFGSEPPKQSRVGSSTKASHKNCKPRFKVTFDMDFSREDTLLPSDGEDVSKRLLVDELAEIVISWLTLLIKWHYHLDSYPDPNMIVDRESLICNMVGELVGRLHDLKTYPTYGPLRASTPTDLREWPIRRGQGIPNYNKSDSVAAWVISWLNPEGRFNALEISGVLDNLTLRGRTTISLAGGPFNAIGTLVRMWAK